MSKPVWTSSDFLAPQVLLSYPVTASAGDPVTVDTDNRQGRRRIHLWTPDRSEIYFELVLYPHEIDVRELAEGQRRYLTEDDTSKWDVESTEPREIHVLGRPGCDMQVWFSDADGRFLRDFYFVSFAEAVEPWSLRMIFDPRSAVNQAILERLEVDG